MGKVLCLFKSHYSVGRSILTLEKSGSSKEDGPRSIVDLSQKEGFKEATLVEDGMSSFLEAYTNLNSVGIRLQFGLRVTICADVNTKDNASLSTNAKYVIFAKNEAGYKRLIKISSFAAHSDNFYYEPRIDFPNLKRFWCESDLMLAIPFYDSFMFNNVLRFSQCVPDFSFLKPIFFVESNLMLFDDILKQKVEDYCSKEGYDHIRTKSVYYENRNDFLAFLTFKCIQNRTLIERPELEHFSSKEFCLESWREQNNG